MILWAWTTVLSGFVLYPLFRPKANAIIPFGVIALGLALFTLFHPGLRKYSAELEDEAGEDGKFREDVLIAGDEARRIPGARVPRSGRGSEETQTTGAPVGANGLYAPAGCMHVVVPRPGARAAGTAPDHGP